MFDAFIEKVQSIDFEDYGTFEIVSAEFAVDKIVLNCSVSIDDGADLSLNEKWQVECLGMVDHSLSLGFVDSIHFFDEHPLLIPYTETIRRLSFIGKAADPTAVVGSLYKAHHEIVGGWFPFKEYLNGFEITEMIEGGFGVLAEGPASLIAAYDEVLKRFGIRTTITDDREPTYWDDGLRLRSYNALSALVLDESYLIAERFNADHVLKHDESGS
jgi:hypothetical protein